MGFVADVLTRVIPVSAMSFVTGTWSDAVASNVWSKDKTAADNTATVRIPIKAPFQKTAGGAKLKSITILWAVGTAAMDAVSAALYKTTVPANGSLMTASTAIATSYDANHDTAAKRLTQDEHTMTLTVTDPAWIKEDESYFVEVTLDAAAGSVVKVFDAFASFEVRV